MSSNVFKIIAGALALVSTCGICAAEDATEPPPCPPGMDINEYLVLCTDGGFLYRPKSGYGSFCFINSQTRIARTELEKVRPILAQEIWVKVDFSDKKDAKAEIVTEIVDRPNESALAIYPDDKRATVNVAALAKDSPTPEILASRTRKEMLRAFSFLTGISGGGIPGRLMDVMTDLGRLDAAKEAAPGELVLRYNSYLQRSGIKPYERVTYREACEEGWAHKPTNSWEQAVWKQVHEKPTKGLKIKYDPKTGK